MATGADVTAAIQRAADALSTEIQQIADALAAQPPPEDLQPQVDALNELASRIQSIIPDNTPTP